MRADTFSGNESTLQVTGLFRQVATKTLGNGALAWWAKVHKDKLEASLTQLTHGSAYLHLFVGFLQLDPV